MQGGEKLSLEQIRALLEATEDLRFAGHARGEVYGWVERTLNQHGYRKQGREVKGVLRAYIGKMTGLSRAQVTRLIGKHAPGGEVREKEYRRRRFVKTYTRRDIELLAGADEAHEIMSGPATRRILEREFSKYGKVEYERLASISVAHLYRLRKSRLYRQRLMHFTKTKATAIPIGKRQRPEPEGRPGFIRVDTVHQGDLDGVKGVYHINAVDEVTQWEVVACVPRICEAWLKPAIKQLLNHFPFQVLGFHTDNGSEFINHTMETLLKKLLVDQTKSRPRRSNDNGLVEAKNGAVIRKHLGYRHIAADHAPRVQRFYEEHFNRYLNFHRPCGQVKIATDSKGKERRTYPTYATPLEVFSKLPDASKYFKPGVTLIELNRIANSESDIDAARKMQDAKRTLFIAVQSARRPA